MAAEAGWCKGIPRARDWSGQSIRGLLRHDAGGKHPTIRGNGQEKGSSRNSQWSLVRHMVKIIVGPWKPASAENKAVSMGQAESLSSTQGKGEAAQQNDVRLMPFTNQHDTRRGIRFNGTSNRSWTRPISISIRHQLLPEIRRGQWNASVVFPTMYGGGGGKEEDHSHGRQGHRPIVLPDSLHTYSPRDHIGTQCGRGDLQDERERHRATHRGCVNCSRRRLSPPSNSRS